MRMFWIPMRMAWLSSATCVMIGSLACVGQFRPHAAIPGVTPPPRVVDPTGTTLPAAEPRGSGPGVQSACRASSVPAEWVVIDYVESERCPSVGGERYSGALIVRHTTYRRGEELHVCADQRVPGGWRRKAPVEDEELQYLCQTSLQAKPVSDRVMLIEKQ